MKANSFLSVMRWELTYHRQQIVKSFLGYFAVMFLVLMLLNWANSKSNDISQVGSSAWILGMISFLLYGGSMFFRDVKRRQQRLDLLMLPASMLEKFVARYLMAAIVSPLIFMVGFLAADVLQYLLMLVLRLDSAALIEASLLLDGYHAARFSAAVSTSVVPFLATLTAAWWYHSLYLLGGVFFRKYGWLWTTLVQIFFFNIFVLGLGRLLLAMLEGHYSDGFYLVMLDGAETWVAIAYFTVMLALTALNYWLSYRIFSRMQLINNKWTNI